MWKKSIMNVWKSSQNIFKYIFVILHISIWFAWYMWVFLGMDQLQNLLMCIQEGAEPGMEPGINLLPPETPQSHALTHLMTRCWAVDPKQRPLAEG